MYPHNSSLLLLLLLLPLLVQISGFIPVAYGVCDREMASSCQISTGVIGRVRHELNSEKSSTSDTDRMPLNETISRSNTMLQDDLTNLDKLRLEYYKYRILSQLEMNINPDLLAAKLRDNYTLISANIAAIQEQQHHQSSFATDRYPNLSSRHKRSPLACNQVKTDKDPCCLDSFYVNFTEIGWDRWILYPSGYYANYCRGQCDLSHARYYHSTLLSKFSALIGLCCSPRQMGSLRLLYIDEQNKVLSKTMPNMIVEKCDCA